MLTHIVKLPRPTPANFIQLQKLYGQSNLAVLRSAWVQLLYQPINETGSVFVSTETCQYFGQVQGREQRFHGRGALLSDDGHLHDGFWVNNRPEGNGMHRSPCGLIVAGTFTDHDHMNGLCTRLVPGNNLIYFVFDGNVDAHSGFQIENAPWQHPLWHE